MQTHESRLRALRGLFIADLLSSKEFNRLRKRSIKLDEQHRKELRQDEVNAAVEEHLLSITPGVLFKHRSVWEAIGRDDFTRDEVLQALKHHKEDGLVDQVRKGNNNFQVFWTRCGAESAEPGQETEQTSADEQQQAQ